MDLNLQEKQKAKVEKRNMLFNFLKLLSINKNEETVVISNADDTYELLEGIKNARKEWINANKDFEYADDLEIIDYHTYKIKACQVRYEYFIRKAKEKGIKVESLKTADVVIN